MNLCFVKKQQLKMNLFGISTQKSPFRQGARFSKTWRKSYDLYYGLITNSQNTIASDTYLRHGDTFTNNETWHWKIMIVRKHTSSIQINDIYIDLLIGSAQNIYNLPDAVMPMLFLFLNAADGYQSIVQESIFDCSEAIRPWQRSHPRFQSDWYNMMDHPGL